MSHNNAPSEKIIRITGLNKDKTRKADTPDNMYHVYFELSEMPSQEWKKIFDQQWKLASASIASEKKPNDPSIEQGFLTVLSPLSDVPTLYLPALQKTAAAANTLFSRYEDRQDKMREEKENIWKDERKEIDEMEKKLTFS